MDSRRIPSRANRRPIVTGRPVMCEDDLYTRLPNSARSYRPTTDGLVVEDGNRRMVIHSGLPLRKKPLDWRIAASLGATGMTLAILAINGIGTWWSNYQIDQRYGNPRTYQVDAVVGHGDNDQHPSHFIFENLRGNVLIIEVSGGDPAHSRIYVGPTLLGEGADKAPVTGEFDDETGHGTRDMVIHVQSQRIVYLNDGSQFKEQHP